ncbi:hypothetical protein [Bradyrhizobium sp. AC87j1]|uniref:hypothetical protein n=1 Tax=Bradyrhizobium sp. AC87j1 TaxID=2055894 RepID=UPI0011B03BAB|nr:hypothetical protein [Bradyrhizobium sp. AC87j1]
MAFPSFIQSSFSLEEAVNPESEKDSVRYPEVAPYLPGWMISLLGVSLVTANLLGSVLAVSRLVVYLSGRFLPAALAHLHNDAPRNSAFFVSACLVFILVCELSGFFHIEPCLPWPE